MKRQLKNVSWRRRRALGGDRSVLPVAVLTAALSVVGCDSGGLGGLVGLRGGVPRAEGSVSAGREPGQFNGPGHRLPPLPVRSSPNPPLTLQIERRCPSNSRW